MGGQLTRELGVVLRLPGVEACVLEHADALIGEQVADVLRHRLHGERRGPALRPAEVRADVDLRGAVSQQQLERRERLADARVVCDTSALERNVEVGPHEHALAAGLGAADRPREPHRTPTGSEAATFAVRSTSRHE